MTPLVSILIPCYNAERWLNESIQSVLAQSWKNLEIILVDDGSIDRSAEIARSFEAPNVQVILQQNQGASSARNRAYAEAQGDFIQYLDADDLLSPDKIEPQVKLLMGNSPDLLAVSSTMHFVDGQNPDEGMLLDGWPMVDSTNPLEWLIDLLEADTDGMVQPGSWLIPRSISEAIGPWDSNISLLDDGEYFARAVLASSGIRKSRHGMNYYRRFENSGSLSSQNSEVYQWGHFRALRKIESHLTARTNDTRAQKAMARCYMELAFNCYPNIGSVSAAAEKRAIELGGARRPRFGTAKGEFLARCFGWKAVRRANHIYHQGIRKF